ncbi:MAG: hemolysin [Rhodobacterales bacterium]|nr:MAG: hemolysin [Rhodobacterales bacterium]
MYVYINGEKVDLLNDPRITLTNNADGDYTGSGDGGLTTIRGRSTAVVSGGALQANEIGYITINDPNGISSVSVEYVGSSDSNGFLYDIGTNPEAWYPPSGPCFADTVMIETADGLKAAGAIRSGDLVKTRDNGFQEVRWVGSHHVAGARMAEGSKLRPIRVRAGALGDNIPAADLLISPQHRVLVRSRIAQRMFGTDEVLVAAKQLLMLEGIDVAEELNEVTYVHILFDDHQIIFSEGAETESLYTGDEALKGVGREAREEIFALFPELRDAHEEAIAARHLATGRMARRLAMRHQQNQKPLVS